ncbi:mrna capping enzyme family protein [Plasmopara halstedii]|uniref:Mrna capping enzyme family protein n=1 Tax=Plasmopara halstedii TaxID=4781 RepID=A0A0P1A7Z0_PLAHL|nr:mrna capping enzyme family protein [Plasmopara halstedii]CEG36790.1 mrna capping enzyme family protein [Plasmopara halstedii]|eukprot:XP_024573159.1 mrna capping enzyme family protein [Plasmopara halstedii]
MSDDATRAEVAAKLRAAQQQKSVSGSRKLLRWDAARWKQFECIPQYTTRIKSAPILPIRAPLSPIYEIYFSDRKSYSPSALMEKLIADTRAGSVLDVGLVIDATGSDTFFHDIEEWDDWDVQYVKLHIDMPEDDEGKDHDDQMVGAFNKTISKHLKSERKDMDVAVFGAEGYDFVGYLIVSFLVEQCGLNLDKALEEFAQSTAPGIFSRHYLERLYRKYYTTLPAESTRLAVPSPPRWEHAETRKRKTGSSVGSEVLTELDRASRFERIKKDVTPSDVSSKTSLVDPEQAVLSSGLPTPPVYKAPLYIPPDRQEPRPAKRRKIRSWVDEVEPLAYGETIAATSKEHQKLTTSLEKLTGIEGFPGCESIPFTATHVAEGAYKRKGCLTKAYLVTWRARGRRCLLYVTADGTFVVSRDMSFTKVNMKFPRRRALNEFQKNTLIDGLLVEDQDQDTKVARYLAFDIIFLEGTAIWQKKLEKRLQCLQNEIIVPRKNDKTFDYGNEPFRVRMKDHFRLAKTEYMLTKFAQSVTHEVDGAIYTPTEAPYNLGGFECDEPIFKFVASEGGGIPGLDGSISERQLLQYIISMPK